MTIDELKQKLDELQISYEAKATKADLEALIGETKELDADNACITALEAKHIRVALPDSDSGGLLNVRIAPEGTVLTVVSDGDLLRVTGEPVDGWVHVLLDGYVKSDFVDAV
ncbi:MAG: hypothetical protein RR619_06790 [Raoultibacter sp.]